MVISFVGHGNDGNVLFGTQSIPVVDIIQKIADLNCPYIVAVAFFNCESLKNLNVTPKQFDILGFRSEIPYDDMILFSTVVMNSFRHMFDFNEAVNDAITIIPSIGSKTCLINKFSA